ncbi:MAG: TIGR00300 family protein [Armatimonadetes bacterium]|jgi:lysine-ketoglutarate reductase/saccharopine dehydrogenase-like protein (TIGR00300 family)|nr:TIGR00300 family protein [Armatimonadota bacterium]
MPSKVIEVRGHIIDSLILPRILDEILNHEGTFEVLDVGIGQRRTDPSCARIRVIAPDEEHLDEILAASRDHGAEVAGEGPVQLAQAPRDGVFPEGFYVTTSYPTEVHLDDQWVPLQPSRMDCGIRVDREARRAEPVKFAQVRAGDWIVVGQQGIHVNPPARGRERSVFEFMSSEVSSEKPKRAIIREVADEMRRVREAGQKILLVGGPALVHTGAVPAVVATIEAGYVDRLFAGNALAVHDIENALYGTSLGVNLERALAAEEGHENHMRAINRIREAGGIREAVEAGVLQSGIMHACVRHGVEFVLAGSIRDDGPLPDVITDVVEAQQRMMALTEGLGIALMAGTALHSIATGNLLPSTTRIVAVDINPSVITKMADRGSFQTVGLVTDVGLFFEELLTHLQAEGGD